MEVSRVSGRLKVATWSVDSVKNSSYGNGMHSFHFTLGSQAFEGFEMIFSAREGKVFRIDLTSPDFRHR